MDWKLAIERNREALGRVIASLVPLAAAMQEVPHPRPLHRFISAVLRPAEAALRRLIVIVAATLATTASHLRGSAGRVETRGSTQRDKRSEADRVGVTKRRDGGDLPPPGSVSRCESIADLPSGGRLGSGRPLPDFSAFARGNRPAGFRLTDPLRRPWKESVRRVRVPPYICVPGIIDRPPKPPEPPFDAGPVLRRIERLELALKSLPRQARRLDRLMRRRAGLTSGRARAGPLRRGPPPGHRERRRHEVDDILRECHLLARDCALKPP